jgi:predicted metalloprotease
MPALLVLVSALWVGPSAHAINPAQTTADGVVQILGYDAPVSIHSFWRETFSQWGRSYTKPRLFWYNQLPGDDHDVCGLNTANRRDNAFYCPFNSGPYSHSIFMDKTYFQKLINGYANTSGDYAPGGLLAHEWGHAVAAMLGYSSGNWKDEYFADCLTGVYTRRGYDGGRLVGSDYGEFNRWLWYQPYSGSHGYGPKRSQWYEYGYKTFSVNDCTRVYNTTAPRVIARATISSGSLDTPPATGISANVPQEPAMKAPDTARDNEVEGPVI